MQGGGRSGEAAVLSNRICALLGISGINNVFIGLGNSPLGKTMNAVRTAVISDLGNVLIHFDNEIFFKKLADLCSFSIEEIASWAGDRQNLFADFDCGRIDPDGFFQVFRERLRLSLDQETFFLIYSDIFSVNPVPIGIMKRLSPDVPLILLSNTDPVRFGFIRSRFPEVMLFDEYVLSYEVGCMKPDPRIYRRAVHLSGLPAQRCIFIDDRLENIAGAERIGMRTVFFRKNIDLFAELKGMGLRFQPGETS